MKTINERAKENHPSVADSYPNMDNQVDAAAVFLPFLIVTEITPSLF